MGPIKFGLFAMVLAYGQLVANLVQFQSWKGVIRFGALHLDKESPDALQRLFGFTASLDVVSAVVGSILAIIAVPLVAPWLNWSQSEQYMPEAFGVILLLSTGGTPSGILRLFDRFDLLAITDAVGPTIRLVGAVIAWLTGGGVIAFLGIWAGAAVGQLVSQWVAAVMIHGSRMSFGRESYRQSIAENPRLWRYMLLTNISNSLSLFWMQVGTLAVGAVAGPAEAGGFRIASRLAKGVGKPIETVTRALYPELAKLSAGGSHATLKVLLWRFTLVASALGLVMMAGLAFGGEALLRLVAGKQFMFASGFLFLLGISAAIDLAGFALEPYHNATGRAGRVLQSRLIGAAVYMALLALLLPKLGAAGAAYAAIGASLAITLQFMLSTSQILKAKTD